MEKILIIEDEHFLLDMYRTKFECEGYKVLTAQDGKEGLNITKKEHPDLILLDIVMPIMDGYDFLHKVRNNKEIKDLKIYIFSNLGQASEIKKGINEGADGYLIKANLTPNQLAKKVRNILDNSGEKTLDKK